MDQVREVLRVRHYAMRTERSYCDWIRRYIQFHAMKSWGHLSVTPETRLEELLSLHPRRHRRIQPVLAVFGAEDDVNDHLTERLGHTLRIWLFG